MGGANTRTLNLTGKTDDEILNSFLPVFYDPESRIEETELDAAKNLWGMVKDNTAPGYVNMKETPGFQYPTSIYFFYRSFYERLFDVHPSCKPLFKKGIKQQGRHLVALISMALTCVTDEEKFKRSLLTLAKTHIDLGVKAYEYAIVAECHFWTMRRVLGAAYDNVAHGIWTKIFSRFMKIMVPITVRHEIHTAGMHAEREKASRIVVAVAHPAVANPATANPAESLEVTDVDELERLYVLDSKEMEVKYGDNSNDA